MTPTLEMLWEDADPQAVLRKRHGLDGADEAADWAACMAAARWPLEDVRCERLVLSWSNGLAWLGTAQGQRLLKWSVDPALFARLQRASRLTAWLAERGVPVSSARSTDSGDRQVESHLPDGRPCSVGLQKVVAGDLLDVDDPAQVSAVGATLARLHLALADSPADLRTPADEAPTPLPDRVRGWLEPARAWLPAAAADHLTTRIDRLPAGGLAAQQVHGDVRAANVLVRDGEVAAFLDLEETRLDQPVAELARAAVLLGTRYRDWAPVSPGVQATFRAGYEQVRPLSDLEAAWWDVLVPWVTWAMVRPGAAPSWESAARALTGA
ncbi:phosphotransferase enzyme family protein [Nocardioides bruguierae]|uniref:Phosphotransferase n=1 Tax=Nocardioides bruguierae TaxID=2945102 RepID=A0A9X2IEW1_9ACTN|nr:phosphotransferase [Nocardioides bruguierae]MCM0619030.1 phosphotransferase [Nocardioides bruguierae]